MDSEKSPLLAPDPNSSTHAGPSTPTVYTSIHAEAWSVIKGSKISSPIHRGWLLRGFINFIPVFNYAVFAPENYFLKDIDILLWLSMFFIINQSLLIELNLHKRTSERQAWKSISRLDTVVFRSRIFTRIALLILMNILFVEFLIMPSPWPSRWVLFSLNFYFLLDTYISLLDTLGKFNDAMKPTNVPMVAETDTKAFLDLENGDVESEKLSW